jgi:4-hydroxy-3-polyprenylbenzoate decarboxylase
MGYRTLRQCVEDLERAGRLVRLDEEIDAVLEAAEIQRRVYASSGPAVLYTHVKNCRFPMVSNLFGTMERVRYIFRDSLDAVRRLIELKMDANQLWRWPARYLGAPLTALTTFPRFVRRGPVLGNETTIDRLPPLTSWPDDGGPFVTLPVVYTENCERPGWRGSNLGMYRVQLAGGEYELNKEVGLHYQIHRGIGVHHAAALRHGQPLRVNIFVGGSPAMAVAAVMPLPEDVSELIFAGALARHRIPLVRQPHRLPIYAEADFCICGTLDADCVKPEGPFGDHLGYYSLTHPFPVLKVDRVYHRAGAIWPFTVVGRPPQEDTSFGQLIHELTAPLVPTVVPGVHAVHAVDAAGVHPLMLAIGSERYVPYRDRRRPQELLTQANAILGQGQMSLAKYLLIVAQDDDPQLDVHNVAAFWRHLLLRVDWRRDLHFQTETTIDTLDYSGRRLHEGSKLIIAATGPPRRELPCELPEPLELPAEYHDACICLPGILAVCGPAFKGDEFGDDVAVECFCEFFRDNDPINHFPLIVVVDDSEFTARTPDNFHWVTFTRSNPAADVYGIAASTRQKHFGCGGSLVIDARIKPHHAPPLVEDPAVTAKIDAMAARGGPLAKYL